MGTPLTLTAVSGWSISPEWFGKLIHTEFPTCQVNVLYPKIPASADEARDLIIGHPADLWTGYSLGALWLMHYRALLPAGAKVALLAPILNFTNDKSQGGKTSPGQLNYLIKLLQRSPENPAPVWEFQKLIGLNSSEMECYSLPETSDLMAGLDFLKNIGVPASRGSGWLQFVGEHDPLLDARRLKELLPSLVIVSSSGHEPAPLLKALAEVPLIRDKIANPR